MVRYTRSSAHVPFAELRGSRDIVNRVRTWSLICTNHSKPHILIALDQSRLFSFTDISKLAVYSSHFRMPGNAGVHIETKLSAHAIIRSLTITVVVRLDIQLHCFPPLRTSYTSAHINHVTKQRRVIHTV